LGTVMALNNLAQNESLCERLKELGVVEALSSQFLNSEDDNVKRECTDALRCIVPDLLLSTRPMNGGTANARRQRRKTLTLSSRTASNLKSGIKENVNKIIQVLIADGKNQERLRESGVIPHLLTLLESSQRDVELKALALDALTMMAINNCNNQLEICMYNGSKGLDRIDSFLKDPITSPTITLRAARVLGALCWKNKIVQGLVQERQLIPILVGMLDTYDNSLKKTILTTLACLTDDYAPNKHEVHKCNGDVLIAKTIMREHAPDSLVAAAAQAIASLSRENSKSQAACSKAVGSVLQLLETAVHESDGNEGVVDQLTGAVLELCRNNKANKSVMWRLEVLKPLVVILSDRSSTDVARYNSSAILWELAKNQKKRDVMRANHNLGQALTSLAVSGIPLVRDAASRLKDRLVK